MKMCHFYFMALLTRVVVLPAADWATPDLHDEEIKALWVEELKEQIYTVPSQQFDHLTLYQLGSKQLEEVRSACQFCNEALINEEQLIKGDSLVEAVFKEFDSIQAAIAVIPEPEDGSNKTQAYVLQEESVPHCSSIRAQALQLVSFSTYPEWKYAELLKEKMKTMEPSAKELFMQQERERINIIGDVIENVHKWRLEGDRLNDSLRAKYGWAKKS